MNKKFITLALCLLNASALVGFEKKPSYRSSSSSDSGVEKKFSTK
jgi:hypothetical protein